MGTRPSHVLASQPDGANLRLRATSASEALRLPVGHSSTMPNGANTSCPLALLSRMSLPVLCLFPVTFLLPESAQCSLSQKTLAEKEPVHSGIYDLATSGRGKVHGRSDLISGIALGEIMTCF